MGCKLFEGSHVNVLVRPIDSKWAKDRPLQCSLTGWTLIVKAIMIKNKSACYCLGQPEVVIHNIIEYALLIKIMHTFFGHHTVIKELHDCAQS